MVKKFPIILSIVAFFGSLFFLLLILQVIQSYETSGIDYTNTDITILEFKHFVSIQSMGTFTYAMAFIIIIYMSILLFLGYLISLKNGVITIGSLFSIIGALALMITWLSGEVLDVMYIISSSIFSLGLFITGFGFLKYSSYTKLITVIGPVLSILTVAMFSGMNTYYLTQINRLSSSELEPIANTNLLLLSIYHFLFFSFVLLFGIFFKDRHYLKHTDEERSVLHGTAFASYSPGSDEEEPKKKKKKKKSKKDSESEDITFDF